VLLTLVARRFLGPDGRPRKGLVVPTRELGKQLWPDIFLPVVSIHQTTIVDKGQQEEADQD
jgi:hypothetical protein